jgi:ABC-2 type transport system permease protein
MNRLVRTELLKQRTTRTAIAGVAVTPAIAAIIALVLLDAAGEQGNEPLSSDSLGHVVAGPASVITLIALLLGVVAMTGEYRHQTITTTFLATPHRRDVVRSKLAAASLTGAFVGALSLVVSASIAVPWLAANGIDTAPDADVVRVAVGLVASTALYGALGVAIGALVRNQTTAVAIVLTWLLAVEGIIGDLVHGAAFVRWLPAAAGRALVHVGSGGDTLPAPAAVAAFLVYVIALSVAALRITVRRDIT